MDGLVQMGQLVFLIYMTTTDGSYVSARGIQGEVVGQMDTAIA
jgi:hypothetical protein